jgi:hypothetical protein
MYLAKPGKVIQILKFGLGKSCGQSKLAEVSTHTALRERRFPILEL